MSYNVKKLPKIICLELGRGWLKSLLYLFPSLSCHPSLAMQTWGYLCCPRVVLRREKDVPVCHLNATGRAFACAENRNDCF